MTRFRIDDSFAIQSVGFVFAGTAIEGDVRSGMIFEIPEAGHRWKMIVKSVEIIRMAGGKEKIGLVVENPSPGYLAGLGVGWTATMTEAERN
jgi:hypothetical protein